MLNPLVTALSGQVTSPFAGGVKKTTLTQKHLPLIWEAMLGTVMARNPVTKEVKYFDYDYAAAHAHALVTSCSDLRISRNATRGSVYNNSWPSYKRIALWGIAPAKQL